MISDQTTLGYDALGNVEVLAEELGHMSRIPAGTPVLINELRETLTWDPIATTPRLGHRPTRGNDSSENRAGIGATAVVDFADKWFAGGNAEDFGTVIGDLLCSLMHLSDSVHAPFDTFVARARSHYKENVLDDHCSATP